MAPLIYPEPTWSNRFGRVVRTLQVVAVAGLIGAVGGGVAVIALVGGGSPPPRHATVLKAGTADASATHPLGAAPAAPQPRDAVAALAPAAAPATPPVEASAQPAPAAAEPPNAAVAEQHPVQEAAEPADSSPGTHVYNRVEPEQKTAPAHTARPRAKLTRRIKNAEHGRRGETSNSAERGRYVDEREARYSDERGGPYSGARYSYRNYDAPPVVRAPVGGYYFGGGRGVYDGGDWGN